MTCVLTDKLKALEGSLKVSNKEVFENFWFKIKVFVEALDL